MKTAISLYTYPTSPYGMKVACYLAYKNIPYRFVPVNPVTNRQIRFTGQRQVPVLEIDGEWRKESSELGIWLDELFPQPPLLGTDEIERQQILRIDHWISDAFIPAVFREAYEWESARRGIINGWRLARFVNDASSIPLPVRALWPFLVKRAGFIVRMMDMLDLDESIADMRQRLADEFLAHLAGGPYLGGLEQPSLADLSIYPIILFGERTGIQGFARKDDAAFQRWARAVQSNLPENPLLVPARLLKHRNPFV